MSRKSSSQFKPMLAVEAKLDQIIYPVIASPKVDGIRCIIRDQVPLTRSLKEIPNTFVRSTLRGFNLPGFDGELVVGHSFNETSSAIMSHQGRPDFKYLIFDLWEATDNLCHLPFSERIERAKECVTAMRRSPDGVPSQRSIHLEFLPHVRLDSRDELEEYYLRQVNKGCEGIMIRDPSGSYKYGRSTLKERGLLKLKPFEDGEAEIVGFVEKEHNENPATTNALGFMERSTKKEGKVKAGTLGSLIVKGVSERWRGVEFEIGTGFNDVLRGEIWENRSTYLGSIVKFKFQEYGSIDRPRLPVFLGFRSKEDMSS